MKHRAALLACCLAGLPMAPARADADAAAPAFAGEGAGTAGRQDSAGIPLRIVRSRPTVPPALARAHTLLQAGRLDDARRAYDDALRGDPGSSEALLGLAVVAARRGQVALAEQRYRQALAADPQNVDAEAALIGLRGGADPARAESRLKQLLAAHPEAAVVHFALGNLHAAQARWNEARLSYLRAHAADRGHPDYLFNLAVSLDRLHRQAAARAHYQAALDALAARTGGFDPASARARIAALTAETPP